MFETSYRHVREFDFCSRVESVLAHRLRNDPFWQYPTIHVLFLQRAPQCQAYRPMGSLRAGAGPDDSFLGELQVIFILICISQGLCMRDAEILDTILLLRTTGNCEPIDHEYSSVLFISPNSLFSCQPNQREMFPQSGERIPCPQSWSSDCVSALSHCSSASSHIFSRRDCDDNIIEVNALSSSHARPSLCPCL